MCEAVKLFDPDRGSFITIFSYCFKDEVAGMYGYKTSKRDAIMAAKSLNQPLGDGAEDLELEDMVPDPNDHYEDAERLMMLEQLHDTLDAALDELPSFSGEVLRQRYYIGMTQTEIAERTGKRHSYISEVEHKAYRQIKRGRYAPQLYQLLYPGEEYRARGLRGTGLTAFKRTGASATENAALQIITQKEKYVMDRDEYCRDALAKLEQELEEARAAMEERSKEGS